jgi:hypothetical protein
MTEVLIDRELLEYLTDSLAARCGTNADEWTLIISLRAALAAPQAPAPKPLTDEQMGKLYRQSALQDQINGITEA